MLKAYVILSYICEISKKRWLILIISLSLPECDEVELVLVAPPDLTRLLQQQQHNVSSKISPNRMPPAAAPIIIATLDS